MKMKFLTVAVMGLFFSTSAWAGVVDTMIERYRTQSPPTAEAGAKLWTKPFHDQTTGEKRSCTTCHSGDLTKKGTQVNTGEAIEPLAPSVNRTRLTDRKFIEKWFKRNCKWTVGRECSDQEKADFLMFIKNQ